jgi:uncharacterized phage protein gp47/JayE
MATLTYSGLSIRTVTQIKEAIELALRETVSPNIDLSSSTLIGQFVSIIANQLALEEEALASIYSYLDPNTAEGDALDRISAFTATQRRPAIKTSLSASLLFSQVGTFPSGTLLASPLGNEQVTFENVHDVVVLSVPHTATNVLMRATDPGPVNVILGPTGPGSLTQIVTPTNGWDGIFGTSNLSQGSFSESDTDLRFRRTIELFSPGTTSVNGIAADLSSQISNIKTLAVLDNPTASTVDGIPPYAFEVIISAAEASDEDIGRVIFENKSAGAPTHGNREVIIEDDFNNSHIIRFSRPQEIPISIVADLTVRPGSLYPGQDQVRQAIITNATSSFVPGLDASPSQVSHWIFDSVPGVLSVDNITINGSSTRFPISIRELAVITSSLDITINSTVGIP